ncbi:MAG: flagellar export protein FliJ [Desulfocapsa sp.]|jgi:flagellar FliJ protein|nr:flagellar export protein FliJ [Desulfocapsa sp.]
MSPKPFSLDSVLRFRKRQEDLAQEQFIRKRLAADKATENLITAESTLKKLIHSLEEKQIHGITIDELSRYEERIQFEQAQTKELQKKLKQKQKAAQQKRQNLLEKRKEHKTLTTLKAQQNKSWKEYVDKKEAAMLDEIAILHHDRTLN